MAIEIRNITKSYGSKKVVDNVSITIPTGKITSFIGPNGAGKSTVLSIMSRLLNADSGEIYLNGELLNRKKSSLSGGQRQRAYIAMTLAQDTDYILLDEPLNNLDMKHSVQIMQVLRKLATELNKTVVIVIHDINFASCYSDYIVAMKNGKLVHQGEVNHIMQSPVLQDIYDMAIPIQDIDDHKIAVYFR